MAFDPNGLSDVAALNRGRTLFEYGTHDPLASVLAAGYFDAAHGLLTTGDSILVSADDGEAIVRVAIVARGAVVAVSQGGAGTANLSIAANELGPGTVERTLAGKAGEIVSIKDRGAVGNGLAIEDAAFLAAIADPRVDVFLPPGVYQLSSNLDVDIANKRFWAIPGTATIRGSSGTYGAATLKFKSINNVGFYGINFYNPGTDATYNATEAVICSLGYDVRDLTFNECEFRAPGTGGQLIALYPNTLPNQANRRTLDGLRIRNCLFDGAGQHAITLMNRTSGGYSQVVSATSSTVVVQPSTVSYHSTNDTYNGLNIKIVKGTGAGQSRTIADYAVSGGVHTVTVDTNWTVTPDSTSWYEIEENSVFRCQNVWMESNIFRRLGLLPSGVWKVGFAASFDGAGTGIHFLHNAIEDTDLGALEFSNTFRDSEIVGNTLKDNGTSLTGMNGFSFSSSENIFSWMRDLTVRGNKCLNALAGHSFFGNQEDGYFEDNLWRSKSTTTSAVQFTNLLRCKVRGDKYHLEGSGSNYTINFASSGGMPCSDNLLDAVAIDPRSSGNCGGVLFLYTGTTRNTVQNSDLNKTGFGYPFTESAGAVSNRLRNTRYGTNSSESVEYQSYGLPDADTSINEAFCQLGRFRFTGTLTATRTVSLAASAQREYMVYNETSQTITLSISSITYSLPSGAKRIVTWTGSSWFEVGALT